MSWWRVGVHQATCGWDLHLTLLLQPLQWLNPRRGSVQQQTSGGRVRRGPNCFDVSRPAVPGGARHTWGAAQPEDIHHPVGPQLFLHNHPPPAFLRLKPGKFGNKTGAVPSPLCPNFRRLDQSMQITAATAIAFAFETAKDCWGIVPSSDYLSSE